MAAPPPPPPALTEMQQYHNETCRLACATVAKRAVLGRCLSDQVTQQGVVINARRFPSEFRTLLQNGMEVHFNEGQISFQLLDSAFAVLLVLRGH